MKIKQHQYELRSRSCLRNLMISNYKESNLVTEHCYKIKSKYCKRSHTLEVTSSKKSDTRLRNNQIHEENMKATKKNKERSMTGSVTSNQNTNLSENKENVLDYKAKQKHKGIVPCRVLLNNCLCKEGERKNPCNEPESVHKTYKQAGEPLNIYSETDHIYLQASQYSYEAVPNVLEMSNISKQFVHKDDSGNNFISRVSYQGQISQRTTVISKETAPQFCSDISHIHALDSAGKSALNESLYEERFECVNSAHMYSKRFLNLRVRKWLHGYMWIWIFLPFLLSLFIFDWHIIGYSLFFSAVHNTSENVTNEFLSTLKVDNNEDREAEEKSIDNNTLVSRIITFEKEQIYLKEYLINITRILEDYKRRQADFEKEYSEKNTVISNKLNISELSNIVNNELKIIKHEFEKLRNFSVELTFFINNFNNSTTIIQLVNNYTKTQVDKILSDYFPPKISKGSLTENMLTSRNSKEYFTGQEVFEDIFKTFLNEKMDYEQALVVLSMHRPVQTTEFAINRTVSNDNASGSDVYMSEEYVRKIVKEILQIYDADKTGQVDYALESAGGEIISTRTTREHNVKSRVFTIFGIPLYYQSYNNNPRTVIQKNAIQPGACWAFQNFPGYLLIRLQSVIYVTGFTLEHVPRSIVPTGNMPSAPRNFNVWGLTDENDPKPVMFGDYEFIYLEDNLQYFPVQNIEIKKPYEYIELRIHSNHGQPDYTCLYKFRVHGKST